MKNILNFEKYFNYLKIIYIYKKIIEIYKKII